MGAEGLALWFCFKGGVLNYARTIVAALRDFEVLLSCPLPVQDGLEIGGDHGLERGPAIERGHDASIHGRPGITVSAALFYGMFLSDKSWSQESCINNVPLVVFSVWKPHVVYPIPLPCYKSVLRKSILCLLAPFVKLELTE